MVLDFKNEEIEELNALEAGYAKLIQEAEEQADKLRPNDQGPDLEEYKSLQESRPKPPKPPEPIRLTEHGEPVYKHDEYEAYINSPEYKAYLEQDKLVSQSIKSLYDEWLQNGSKEWQEAREKAKALEKEFLEARSALLLRIENRQLNELGGNVETILEDAKIQVERLIYEVYKYYDDAKKKSDFSSPMVRLQEDGNFKIDAGSIKDEIFYALEWHIRLLTDEKREELYEFIENTLATSPFVSEAGLLGMKIPKAQKEDAKKGLLAIRPRIYKQANTKINKLLFENILTTTNPNYFTPVALNKAKTVQVFVNYVPAEGHDYLGLDDYTNRMYAGIFSCLVAGNNFIPFTMLLNRGMQGLSPNERGREITPNEERDIIETLSLFDGRITIDNDPTGEKRKADPDFKREVINEPLLFYQIREETVHGQVTRGIAIPSGYIPVGYRYAESNGNEILTDPIESIHVDGLNYSIGNVTISSTTYVQVKRIQHDNSQKRYQHEMPENRRTITYEYVAERLFKRENNIRAAEAKRTGQEYKPKTYDSMSQTERSRLKAKIDKCMASYQKNGLFDHYKHKRDTNKAYYAVVLYFEKEPQKLPKRAK